MDNIVTHTTEQNLQVEKSIFNNGHNQKIKALEKNADRLLRLM